jgi:hypothetical protein
MSPGFLYINVYLTARVLNRELRKMRFLSEYHDCISRGSSLILFGVKALDCPEFYRKISEYIPHSAFKIAVPILQTQ